MNAIAIVPGTSTVRRVERPEPAVRAPDDVKVRVIRVGICGTDREEASGGRAAAPPGSNELVIGHEMFGVVEETGADVRSVRPGDYAVFTVRRGCGRCLPCAMNRSDMCRTGGFTERGIDRQDGFQTEYVVDREPYVVSVPREIAAIGVLTEPLSVVEKAIAEAVGIQLARLPAAAATPDWLHGRHCLVAGLGPIGLLAAMVLRLRDATVFGMDIVDEGTARPQWLESIGGRYIDGRKVPPDRLRATFGAMDLLFGAAGAPGLTFRLPEALALNGIYVLTGIPAGDRLAEVPAAELTRDLVLNNQVMMGSVNAARGHFQMAVDDLDQAHRRWTGHIERLITQRYPPEAAAEALHHAPPDEIKAVIEWSRETAAPGGRGTEPASG